NKLDPEKQITSVILPPRTVAIPELPKRMDEPFSAIIDKDQAAEILSWIDPESCIPCEFQLILRGSRYGFNFQTFQGMILGHERT
ncbi:10258_t:CDS:1, partial [Acaulospora colombiana]